MSSDTGMHVIKRSGSREEVSFDKILKRIQDLSKGLDHVNPAAVAQKVCSQLQDNMNTSLVTNYTVDTTQGSSCSFSFVNKPGSAGTFTYTIRIVATASANTLYLRQIYLNAIKISP